MTSIQSVLHRRIVAGTALLLLLAGSVLCVVSHTRLVHEFDRVLEAKASALLSITSREGDRAEFDFDPDHMPAYDDAEEPEYFALFHADGLQVRAAPALGDGNLPFPSDLSENPVFRNLRLPDGRRGRMMQVAFTPEPDEDEEDEDDEDDEEDLFDLPATADGGEPVLVLVVASAREDLDALLASLYGALALLVLLQVAGAAFLVHAAIRRGFRPIDTLNAQIGQIGPDALVGRVELPAPPTELAAIVAALNGLLDRLEHAFQRERRFSSDVAHELRTPVAELRMACDIGAQRPEDAEAIREMFQDVGDIARHMERVVNSLLALSRCDNGTATVDAAHAGVEALVRDCWRRAAASAPDGAGLVEIRIDPALAVETDPDKLEMIVQNIIDNAAGHRVPGATVTCTSHPTETGVDLVVSNPVTELEPGDVTHVFDRFWQKDAARSNGNRSGLGLSIVQALCALLGLAVHADLLAGPVFQVRLSFPQRIIRAQ